jgi:hypothetical protein
VRRDSRKASDNLKLAGMPAWSQEPGCRKENDQRIIVNAPHLSDGRILLV